MTPGQAFAVSSMEQSTLQSAPAILEIPLFRNRAGEQLYLYNGTADDLKTASLIFEKTIDAGLQSGAYQEIVHVLGIITGKSLVKEDLQAVLKKQGVFWLVKDAQGNPVGFVAGSPIVNSTLSEQPTWKINKLYILPEYHGSGAGKQLLKKIMQAGLGRGYQQFYLETLTAFQDAQALYRKAGFEVIAPTLLDLPNVLEMFCATPAFALAE